MFRSKYTKLPFVFNGQLVIMCMKLECGMGYRVNEQTVVEACEQENLLGRFEAWKDIRRSGQFEKLAKKVANELNAEMIVQRTPVFWSSSTVEWGGGGGRKQTSENESDVECGKCVSFACLPTLLTIIRTTLLYCLGCC